MVNRFTPKAQAALSTAKKWAEKMGHSYIGSEHLILGILGCESLGKKLLEDKHITFEDVYERLVEIAGTGKENSAYVREMTPRCKKIVERSADSAKRLGSQLIGTEHILYSICEDSECVGGRILSSVGANLQALKGEIISYLESNLKSAKRDTSEVCSAPLLFTYGRNLTLMAQQGKLDPLIGRDKEVERLIQVLCRRTKNNPCLVGEPGVGKTSIVEGLAQKITSQDVPTELRGKIIVALDVSAMIAGTKYRGEFEERMKGVLGELRSNPSIIIFIDELHTIMGAGAAEGAIDAANILKPSLARGQIRLIGATTFDEYRHHIEKDSALERRFQPITVKEPTKDEAYKMLLGLRQSYESFHGVKIPDEVIMHSIVLSQRYINDRFLPDKAIDVIDEACSRVKTSVSSNEIKMLTDKINQAVKKKEEAILTERFDDAREQKELESSLYNQLDKALKRNNKSKNELTLTKTDIEEVVSQWSSVPISQAQKNEAQRYMNIDGLLSERIIGQREAVEAVARSLKRGRAGLKNPNKPIGSFLFVGPTGVGKTELAKAIAQAIFGESNSLIRLDMSEYAEKHSISRLVGSPPGYVGYEDGGTLSNAVKKSPYSVVLFDEIEKAHPDIYNLLLQILDEGMLTDSRGRQISFKDTIIVLTSNVGASERSASPLGFATNVSTERTKRIHLESLKNVFKPELLNRLDEIVVFKELCREDLVKIAALMLDEVRELSAQIGIKLCFDSKVADFVVDKGYKQEYGARPIRRAITNLVETPLSEEILSSSLKKGDDVSVFCENGHIKFKHLNPV